MGKGRAPCCDKKKVKTGAWTPAEDLRLTAYIHKHGHTNWRALPTLAGLMRCGKSCRLRWINYLRPDVKRGNFTPQEEQTIINLHNSFGNKWSKIASYLPGRTDNEIKNVWNTHLKKRLTNPNSVHETEAKQYSTTSDSCTSSSITSAEDSNVQNGNPNEKPEFPKIESAHPIQLNPTSDSPADDGKIEIPVDSDIDIWALFDSQENEDPNYLNSATNEEGCNIEYWLRFLEDEVGLMTSDHVDQTTTHEHEEIDYFPIWPYSPLNL